MSTRKRRGRPARADRGAGRRRVGELRREGRSSIRSRPSWRRSRTWRSPASATTSWPGPKLGRGGWCWPATPTPCRPTTTPARIDGDTLWGLGSADMKGGLAVMFTSARRHIDPAVDVTYVFYAREEVRPRTTGWPSCSTSDPTCWWANGPAGRADRRRDRGRLPGRHPDAGDAAGARAHVARAWMGATPSTGSGALLGAIAATNPPPDITAAVSRGVAGGRGHGGVSGNVVPDRMVIFAHRFAPDRVRPRPRRACVSARPVPGGGRHLEWSRSRWLLRRRSISRCCLRSIPRHKLEVRAKLGWTDVARFAERGVPAANFGPGDPTLAHTADERVDPRQHRPVLGGRRRPPAPWCGRVDRGRGRDDTDRSGDPGRGRARRPPR